MRTQLLSVLVSVIVVVSATPSFPAPGTGFNEQTGL